MAVVSDPLAYPLAEHLAECLCGILEEERPVKCCCVQYGDAVSWDDCSRERDREGMAWTRVVSIYPSRNFPQADATRVGPCDGGAGWAVMIELGVLRCAPTIDERGRLPQCWEISAAASKALDDAQAMRRAIMCCGWRPDDNDYVIGSWHPLGGEGGCMGGSMTVTVQVFGCIC